MHLELRINVITDLINYNDPEKSWEFDKSRRIRNREIVAYPKLNNDKLCEANIICFKNNNEPGIAHVHSSILCPESCGRNVTPHC